MWNFVEIQRCPLFFVFLFCPSNTDLAVIFFLTRENQVGYYILSWCWWWLDHLFTRCTRCPPCLPVCAWKECRQDDRMAEDAMKTMRMMMIGSVYVIATMLNVVFFSCPWEIHEKFWCVWERESVDGWMYTRFCAWLTVVIAKKFKNIGTIAYVS